MKLTEEEILTLTQHNAFFTDLAGVQDMAGEGIQKLEECISIVSRHEALKGAMYPYQLEKIKMAVVTNSDNAGVVRSLFEIVPAILCSIYLRAV
jgi:hypothetical protein